mmetsp:Transcript_2767/g.9335  ORF Transcript_2767/g.9335 Transcript_2767/m.9335 type:complete len:279 (-) Transcript_2767:1014-1850(-)
MRTLRNLCASVSRRAALGTSRRPTGCATSWRNTVCTLEQRRVGGRPQTGGRDPSRSPMCPRRMRRRPHEPVRPVSPRRRCKRFWCSASRRGRGATTRRPTCYGTSWSGTESISTPRITSGTAPTARRAPLLSPRSRTMRWDASLPRGRRRACVTTTRRPTGCAISSTSSASRSTTRRIGGTRRMAARAPSSRSPACTAHRRSAAQSWTRATRATAARGLSAVARRSWQRGGAGRVHSTRMRPRRQRRPRPRRLRRRPTAGSACCRRRRGASWLSTCAR